MKQISTLLLIALTAVVFTGCSENTVGGGSIQKRKYTKGFYLNRHSSGKAADNDATAEVAVPKEEKQERIRPALKEEAVSEANEQTVSSITAPEEHAVAVTAPAAAAHEHPIDAASSVRSDNALTDEAAQDQTQMQQQPNTGEKQVVQQEQHKAAAAESAVLVILLVILAFFLPWLSVLLYEGATSRFWIILLLWLLAIIGFFWPIAYALAVIAVVFAILIVLGIV